MYIDICINIGISIILTQLFQSSIDTYEEIMLSGNTVHTNQHQTKLPKGTVIVLYFLVLFHG
jgi:hypothetical protein